MQLKTNVNRQWENMYKCNFFFLTLVLIIYKKLQIWTLSKGGNDTTSNYSTNKPHPKTTRNLDLSKLQPQDNQDYKNLLSFTNNSKSQQGGPEATSLGMCHEFL